VKSVVNKGVSMYGDGINGNGGADFLNGDYSGADQWFAIFLIFFVLLIFS